jgi:hypothetical protein
MFNIDDIHFGDRLGDEVYNCSNPAKSLFGLDDLFQVDKNFQMSHNDS